MSERENVNTTIKATYTILNNIHVNYIPYLYKYEGIIPLLSPNHYYITNNSGITTTSSLYGLSSCNTTMKGQIKTLVPTDTRQRHQTNK